MKVKELQLRLNACHPESEVVLIDYPDGQSSRGGRHSQIGFAGILDVHPSSHPDLNTVIPMQEVDDDGEFYDPRDYRL